MQSDHTFSPEPIAFHSLTPIFQRTTVRHSKKLSLRKSKERLQEWTVNSGFFVFGGVKSNGKETNELYILRALSQEHQVVEPDRAYYFQCVKPEIKGRAPIPRSHHSACWLTSQYLLIYGGRSTQLIGGGASVSVNDVVALNLELMQWQIVAAYGYHPEGRWSAGILEVERKIVILGGENQEGSLGEQPFCFQTDGGNVKDLIATFRQKCQQFEKYRHFLQTARQMGKGD